MKNLTNISFTRRSLMAGAMLGLLGSFSDGAVVTWGAPQAISGDADVSTDGTLVAAFNVGDLAVASATVNGVFFQGFVVQTTVTSASSGNFSLSASGGDFFLSSNADYGSVSPPSPPFTGLSAPYQTILGGATITAQPTTFALTMGGLTPGESYQFQWWANLSGAVLPGVSTLHAASAGNTVTLNDNPSGLEGGLGQYVTGTFVADGTSQMITFLPVPAGGPNSSAQLNAFQLRQIPEPSSIGLLGLAAVTLGFRARLRKKH
jgi:hypothetical protein